MNDIIDNRGKIYIQRVKKEMEEKTIYVKIKLDKKEGEYRKATRANIRRSKRTIKAFYIFPKWV